MWLADDDTIIGDYIEDCINIFENNPNVSLIHNKVNNISETTNKLDFHNYKSFAIKNIFNF